MRDYKTILRNMREDRDLTQTNIAEILHCTKQNYGQIENGKVIPSIKQMVILSNYYNVSIDYILARSTAPMPYSKKQIFDYSFLIKRIVTLRKHNNYKQVYIAKEVLNMSQAMYSHIENMVYQLDLISLIKLADLYSVSINYVLGFEQPFVYA